MADTSPEKTPDQKPREPRKKLRTISRLGVGTTALMQLTFGLLIFLAASYLGITHYTRIDLTESGNFTLSDTTTKLLKSELIQSRDQPVKLIAALRKNTPYHTRFRNIIEEYQRLSGNKLQVEFLDPIRNQDRALEVSTQYGNLLKDKLFIDDLFIIDARTTNEKGELSENGLRFLQASDMIIWQTDDKKQRRVVAYQDEDRLSTAIRSSLEGKPRPFYFISDKSNLDVGDMNSPWRVLAESFLQQNIALTPIKISDAKEIPLDAVGLALIAPQYDLEPAELELIKKYWATPSAALFITLDPSATLDNLRAFLRKHGVTPRQDRILTTRNGRTETQITSTFTPGLDLTNDLAGQATTFEGRVSSLEVREGAQDLATEGIQAFSLIESAEEYWGETRFTESDPQYNDNEDNSSPLAISAAVLRGNANADDTAEQISKMIILSTSDFLHPDRLRQEQVDFIKNSANWLVGKEELIGIGPRGLERRKLNLIPSQISFLGKIIYQFIPITLILIALIVWNIRRA